MTKKPNKNGSQRCPVCRASTQHDYRPFCSKRCANLDLGRWLGGRYAIPGHPDTEEDGELPVAPNDDGSQS
ncbi:MAG: DNA gyrase inhibitor YacG [Hyphomicrobiaceae bacterium]